MPIYAYLCGDCGHDFDVIQKMSDSPLVQCPSCEKDSLKKQLTAPSFRLSGSGWYETDFKKDKRKNLTGDTSSDTPSNTPSNTSTSKGTASGGATQSKESSAATTTATKD